MPQPPAARYLLLPALSLLLWACATTDPKSLQQGFDKYTAHQAGESELISDTYIRANPNAGDIDQAYYLRGISRMSQGKHAAAADDLHLAITKTTRADLRSKAYRALGDMSFDARQFADANKSYELALDNLTLSPVLITEINYRIGVSLQALGEWTRSVPWFSKVIAAHGNPALADSAVHRLHATSFALQYGTFPDRAAAQALQGKLRSAGISAVITSEIGAENKLWLLVQSGSYPVWSAAAAARAKVPAGFAPVIVPPLDH